MRLNDEKQAGIAKDEVTDPYYQRIRANCATMAVENLCNAS